MCRGTYGGNVVACAAAVATIEVIRDEGLLKNTRETGQELLDGLGELQSRHPEIGDVRVLGLMLASEFTVENGEPMGDRAALAARMAHDRGLMPLTCGAYGQVVRWIPPLVVQKSQIHDGLRVFSTVLEEIKA